jgi:hypothetical protein
MRPAYLRTELLVPSKLDAAEMPTLRGFDEEFGQDAVATQLGEQRRTRWTLIAVALGVGIIGALTFAWSTVDGPLRLEPASAPTSPRNTGREGSRELVDRLLRQVEALKGEIRELREAQQQQQQQPAHAIAAIEAEQESRNRVSSAHWYSDPAALSFGLESRPEPWGVVPLPRRPANARPPSR